MRKARWHPLAGPMLALAIGVTGWAAGEPPTGAAEEYHRLVRTFQQAGGAAQLADRFMTLAVEHPDDPVAIDALAWVVIHLPNDTRADQAAQILVERYRDHERMVTICPQLAARPAIVYQRLLENLSRHSRRRSIQAHASFALAQQLDQQLRAREALAGPVLARRRAEQYYGKDLVGHLKTLDPQHVSRQIEQLYDRTTGPLADVDPALTEQARVALLEIRHLAVGRPAMEIEGQDIDGYPMKLSDFRGKVVVLSFWGHW